jgi:hypothetical protein
MKPFLLSPAGQVTHADGRPYLAAEVDATEVAVPHLTPHVERWTMPKGDEVGVLVRYSCHCWTSAHDPERHEEELRILDGVRARVCDPARFEASRELPDLIRAMHQHRIYVTASERNYGVYNMAFTAPDGLSYTAFFMLRKNKGRFDGARHKLLLTVESAYHTVQQQKGTKTSMPAVLSAALRGKTVRYRR